MTEKIIRDPVHDVIAFRLDRPADRLLWELLQTPEFQRLRRVRQLGLANLAYPGADHSRYGHSLGVLEMCRRILEQLSRTVAIDEADYLTVTAAALLHDLGHGPFSHVFERVSGTHHEAVTRRIICEDASGVAQVLSRFDPSLPQRVGDLLAGETPAGTRAVPRFLRETITSQLDADRLDYLLRDDLMTGSRYGQYDLQWLLRSMTVGGSGSDTRLAISYKGVSAVEGYLQARQHMYRNVYFHKVVRSGEGMLRLALQRARRLAVQERLPGGDTALNKALLGQRLSVTEFATLDDISVLHCFKLWTGSDDAVLASLCHGLLFRKLFKTVELPIDWPADRAAGALRRAVDAISHAGGDPAYDLFYDEPSDTPYESVSPDDPAGMNEIQLLDATATLRPFTSGSPFGASLRHFAFRRIHVREPLKDTVLKAVQL
jgi:HD superfamily phosphohydrolase